MLHPHPHPLPFYLLDRRITQLGITALRIADDDNIDASGFTISHTAYVRFVPEADVVNVIPEGHSCHV